MWRVLMQCAVEGPEKHLDKFFANLHDMIENEPIHYGVSSDSDNENEDEKRSKSPDQGIPLIGQS
jgi:hypothetical protein